MPACPLRLPHLAALCLSMALSAFLPDQAAATQPHHHNHHHGHHPAAPGHKKHRHRHPAAHSAHPAAKGHHAVRSATHGYAAKRPPDVSSPPHQPDNAAPVVPLQSYAERLDTRSFISDMAERHGFDQHALLALFAQVSPNPRTLALMRPVPAPPAPNSTTQPAPPAPPPNWQAYRARFLQPARIRGGLQFWDQYADALTRATQTHGVPAEIIVAIIGVETRYGHNTGSFPVIQALSTLAFDFPPRAAYFRSELEHFLLYCRENGIDPLRPLGSYAGAMGIPQFMPGSILQFATDFDGDGRIDLSGSAVDAIGSVARFLTIHGWQKKRALYYPATLAEHADPAALLAQGPKPTLTAADLKAHGIDSPTPLPANEPLMLVDLPNGQAPTRYIIGTGNFYAITRYNRSFFYAMAVSELAEVLHQQHVGSLEDPQLALPGHAPGPATTPPPGARP